MLVNTSVFTVLLPSLTKKFARFKLFNPYDNDRACSIRFIYASGINKQGFNNYMGRFHKVNLGTRNDFVCILKKKK